MNIRIYALIVGSLLSIQSVLPSSVPMQAVVLARPGASVVEIEQSIASLEQHIDIARRLENNERLQELLVLLAYYQNQLRVTQGKSAEQLERDNQLLRLSARNSRGEWKEFWHTAGLAVGVVACAIIITPVVVFSVKVASDMLKS